MKRRSMIKNALLGAATLGLPADRLLACGSSGSGSPGGGFHKFSLGELELCVVSDGSLRLAPVQSFFAQQADAGNVNQVLQESFRPVDAIDLGLNVLVIRKGSRVFLVDCGIGETAGKGSGWLPASLSEAGISIESVTDVVLTHGHFDHTGGLLNSKGELVFRNAKYYISKVEYNFWMAATQDFSKCTLKDKALLQATTDNAKKIIRAISSKIQLLDATEKLFDCIRFEIAAGHTPGHLIVIVYSGGEELVHIADLVHSDILVFRHPEWGFAGDTDFEEAILTRKKVLEELTQSRSGVLAYHLAWPGLGHVRKNDRGYEWVPSLFAHPG